MRLEKLHLDCASSAPSQHGSTPVALLHRPRHREDYLQGPAGISPRRGSAGGPGAALVGLQLLYSPAARLCPRSAFSHVVAYTRQTSALRLRGTADSLLDSASYGVRRLLLSPAPAAGVVAGSRARRPRPGPTTSRTVTFVLVTVMFGPARPVGPDGCGLEEILSMSGPMSERAPDITVEADAGTRSLSQALRINLSTSQPLEHFKSRF
jgi:hypothetical protein